MARVRSTVEVASRTILVGLGFIPSTAAGARTTPTSEGTLGEALKGGQFTQPLELCSCEPGGGSGVTFPRPAWGRGAGGVCED